MMADPERQPPGRRGEYRGCALLGRENIAGGIEKCRPGRRQPYRTRRALKQLPAKVVFQAFQLGADGGLRGVQRIGGTRKGLQLGCQDEGVDGAEVQVSHLAAILYGDAWHQQ